MGKITSSFDNSSSSDPLSLPLSLPLPLSLSLSLSLSRSPSALYPRRRSSSFQAHCATSAREISASCTDKTPATGERGAHTEPDTEGGRTHTRRPRDVRGGLPLAVGYEPPEVSDGFAGGRRLATFAPFAPTHTLHGHVFGFCGLLFFSPLNAFAPQGA